MPIFIQLVTFSSSTGKFNADGDTQAINEVLQRLQDKGARIISIVPQIGGATSAVYTITYEAPKQIK